MLIIHPTGIDTRLLCPASKRYLSRLLVGTTGINPNFISWKQVLKQITHLYPLLLNPFPEGESASSVHEKSKIWNRLFSNGQLKPQLLKSLTEHEKEYNEAELKKNCPYHLKKKSILSLLAFIISVGILCPLFLLIPIATSAITLISALIFATILIISVLTLDIIYPTTLLKTAQNTEPYQQKVEVAQKIKPSATRRGTENNITKIPSWIDKKKSSGERGCKSFVFNNSPPMPTHFFHPTLKKIPQRASNCHKMNPQDVSASNLNQNLCTVLSHLD
jgi:hypothetical protein